MDSPSRRRLPDMRPSMTRKTLIEGHEFYITVGFYDDEPGRCQPAEVFVTASKNQATAVNAAIQAWMVTMSLALQSGVPWSKLFEKFRDSDNLVSGLVKAIDGCVSRRIGDVGYDEEPPNATK